MIFRAHGAKPVIKLTRLQTQFSGDMEMQNTWPLSNDRNDLLRSACVVVNVHGTNLIFSGQHHIPQSRDLFLFTQEAGASGRLLHALHSSKLN